jgi:hypothetical protein
MRELIYFVPNRDTAQARDPSGVPFSHAHSEVPSDSNFPKFGTQVISYDQDQEPGNASLDSFFNLALQHPSPYSYTCDQHVSDPFRDQSLPATIPNTLNPSPLRVVLKVDLRP